jgi:prefoldin subunit 5
MENLNGTLEELSNEAEEANSKLSEIGSDRNNLKTLQSTLDNLVKGTNEWK